MISVEPPAIASKNEFGTVKLSSDFKIDESGTLELANKKDFEPIIYQAASVLPIVEGIIKVQENAALYRSFINRNSRFSFDFSGFEQTKDIAFEVELIADAEYQIEFSHQIKWELPCTRVNPGKTVLQFWRDFESNKLCGNLKETTPKNADRLLYDSGEDITENYIARTNGCNWASTSLFNPSRTTYSTFTALNGVATIEIDFLKSAYVSIFEHFIGGNNKILPYLYIDGSVDGKNWKRLLSLENIACDVLLSHNLLQKGYFRHYKITFPTIVNLRIIAFYGSFADDKFVDFVRVFPRVTADVTGDYKITYTPKTSSYPGAACNLTDNSVSNYMRTDSRDTDGTLWVKYELPAPEVVNFLDFAASQESVDQTPYHFKLEASNDDQNWNLLLERSSLLPMNKGEVRQFYFANEAAYKYYKLSAISLGSSVFALSRFRIYRIEEGYVGGTTYFVPYLNLASENGYETSCSSGDSPFYVFNGKDDNRWSTASGVASNSWIQIKFPTETICSCCSMKPRNDSSYGQAPNAFKIEASNDGENYVLLKSCATIWEQGTEQMFSFFNETAFLYYRLFIISTQTTNSEYASIVSLNFGSVFRCYKRNLLSYINLVPALSAQSQNGYVVTSSSNYSTSEREYKAFDGNANTIWGATAGNIPGWIQVELPEAKSCDTLILTARNSSTYAKQTPLVFRVQGSNDNENWTDLHVCPSQPNWNAGETRIFPLTSTGEYLIYRLYVEDVLDTSRIISAAKIEFSNKYEIKEY